MTKSDEFKEGKLMKMVKWSQWDPTGMVRFGEMDPRKAMRYMCDLGRDAAACLRDSDKNHAVYGLVMHDAAGHVSEVRYYRDTYVTDDELDTLSRSIKNVTFYVAHKR